MTSTVSGGNGITAVNGETVTTYPDFEASDPRPAKDRGYHFDSNQFLTLPPTSPATGPPIMLSPTMTISFWVRPEGPGQIYSKQSPTYNVYTLSIDASYRVVFTGGQPRTVVQSPIVLAQGEWSFVAAMITCFSAEAVSTEFFLNGVATGFINSQFVLYDPFPTTAQYIGKNFTGFIWRVTFRNYAVFSYSSDITSNGCPAGRTACLSPASFEFAPDGQSCPGNCANGCARATDCGLCSQVMCDVCPNFETTTCTTCIPHASPTPTCTCDFGYNFNNASRSCILCPPLCASCLDASSCSVCVAGATMVGTCTCTTGYYQSANSCLACNPTCATCSGGTNSQCSGCHSGASLAGTAPNSCVCNLGTYPAPDSSNCAACHSTCASCSASGAMTDCGSCKANAHLSSPAPSSCTCDDGFFPSPDPGTCSACSTLCLTCSGASSYACYSCKAHMNLAGTAPNQCVCDTGYYMDTGTGVCGPCASPCVACEGTAASCTSCGANAHIESSTCVCDAGFYGSGACQACDTSCLTCTAGGSSSCDSCHLLWVLAATAPAACVCELGRYLSAPTCELCHATCRTCTGPADTSCLSCKAYASLVAAAPSACQCTFFPSSDPANCQGCVSSCDTCSSPTDASTCLTCKNHAVLSAGYCVCEVHYYPVPDAGNCQVCHSTCLACSGGGSSDCQSCQASATLQSAAPSACACASGFYPEPDPSFCNRCAAACKECVHDTASKCTTCWSGAELAGTSPNSCVCTHSFFPSPNVAHCQPCNPLCAACLSTATECTGCALRAHLTGPSPSACVCDSDTFLASNTCAVCDDTCATCLAAGPSSCLSCSPFSSLLGGGCVCDMGYYRVGKNCVACSPLCQTCSVGGSSGCTACGLNAALAASPPASCNCVAGYRWDSNNCVKCVSYFDPTAILAYFGFSYTTLIVTFPQPVDTSSLANCRDIFNETTLSTFGQFPTCSWSSDQLTVTTLLWKDFTLRDDFIELNTDRIGAKAVNCNAVKRRLLLQVKYAIMKYPPSPVISTTSVHSPECGPSLRLSAAGTRGLAGLLGLFKWSLVLLPSAQELNSFDSFSASNMEVSIPNSQLLGDQLKITVFVRDAFGKEGSTSSLLELVSANPLVVSLDAASPIRTTPATPIKVSASAKLPCTQADVDFTYHWNITYASSDKAIPFTPDSFRLYISAFTLSPSSEYRFQLTVTGGGFTGNTTLTIFVSSTPLVVAFDRSDGEHSAGLDLEIDASSSRDPDDSAAALLFQWNCTEGPVACFSADGKSLTLGESALLSIKSSELRVGAKYLFTLKLSSASKLRTASIAIDIVFAADLGVKIFTETVRVAPGEMKIVYPLISSSSAALFQWAQYSGRALAISTPLSVPWIKIPAGQISPGEAYKFSLQATTAHATLTQYLTILANYAPAFGSFQCSPIYGEAISDDFLMQAIGWEDPDGTDYPLTYQFGVQLTANKTLYVSDAQLLFEYTSFFFPGPLTLVVRVCDSIKGCESATTAITVTKPKRMLQSTLDTIKSRFRTAIKTTSKIPSTVIAYAKTVTDVVDQELFSMMLNATNFYLTTLNYSDNASLASQLSCSVALANLTRVASVGNVRDVGSFIISSISLSVEKINDANVQVALAMFTDLFGRNDITAEIMKYNAVIFAYLELVPADSPVIIVGTQSTITASRVLANDPKSLNLVTPSFKLQFPSEFLSDLSVPPNTICDLRVSQFLNLADPSPVLSVSLFKAGTLDNGNAYQGSAVPLPVATLNDPVNITMPMNKIIPTISYTAYAKQENQVKWSTAGVNLALVSYASTIVQAYHFTSFKVAERHRLFFDFEPWPMLRGREGCAKIYSPLIAVSVLLALSVLPVLLRCRCFVRAPVLSVTQVKSTPAASPRDSVVIEPKGSPTNLGTIVIENQFIPKHRSVLSFNPFLGFAFDKKHRPLRVLMAASILLLEELALGVCNTVRFSDWDEDVEFLASYWEWSDFVCCLCALLAGQVYAWVLSGVYSKLRNHRRMLLRCFAVCVVAVDGASALAIALLTTAGCDSVMNRWTAEIVAVLAAEFAVCSWIHTLCTKSVFANRQRGHERVPTSATIGNS